MEGKEGAVTPSGAVNVHVIEVPLTGALLYVSVPLTVTEFG
jgi:hypothetical protein